METKIMRCNCFFMMETLAVNEFQANKYMLTFNLRNTTRRSEISSKLTIKKPKTSTTPMTLASCHWRLSRIFTIHFKHVQNVFILLFFKMCPLLGKTWKPETREVSLHKKRRYHTDIKTRNFKGWKIISSQQGSLKTYWYRYLGSF